MVTAGAVLKAIDRTKYDVLPIGITADGRWALTADAPERMAIADRRTPNVAELAESQEGGVVLPVDPTNREVVYSEPGSVPKALGEVDVVFPVLHGPYGEDGTLQGLLELSGGAVRRLGRALLGRRPGQGVHEADLHLLRPQGRPVPGDPAPASGRRTSPPPARRSSTSPVSTAGRCS
ncbi:hypothetical protein LT493_19245 [Streptomyces tricolor]|nr:hypothetical protein [Streptomyces tricolor]